MIKRILDSDKFIQKLNAVYQDSMVQPYTGQGMDIFRDAWDNTAK